MAKGFPRGLIAAFTRGGNGALAHRPPPRNLKNVDFSGVARFFGLEGHKGAKVFHVGGHGCPHEEDNGALAHPLWNLKKCRFQWRNQDFGSRRAQWG